MSQQPDKVEMIIDRQTGKEVRLYTYKNKNGDTIQIRDDKYGHNYPDGSVQNRDSHFNAGIVDKPQDGVADVNQPEPKLKDHYDY